MEEEKSNKVLVGKPEGKTYGRIVFNWIVDK
jgi:hypothetical protein